MVKIPLEVDIEDLKIVFESNVFGYQTIVDVKEIPIQDSNLKNVIIELDSAEGARLIAKSTPFPFDFGKGEILLRPVLYFDSVGLLNKPKQNEDPKIDPVVKKELQKLSTCWIGNIPDKHTEENLKEFFKKQTEAKIDKFHSIKLIFNKKINKYQCFINVFNQDDARTIADFFNGSKMENCKLEANVKNNDAKNFSFQNESDSDSESSEFDQENVLTVANKDGKFQKNFCVHNSKNFKSLIKNQIDSLALKLTDISIKENISRKGNLSFRIEANSEAKLADALAQLSKIKIVRNKTKYSVKEFAQIQTLKPELDKIKPKKNEEFFKLFFKRNSLVVEFFDSGENHLKRDYYKYLNQIGKFCQEKIESEKEIVISDSDQLEFFKLYLKNTTNLKYNLINTVDKGFKINLSGKKINLDKFNWSELAPQIKVANFTKIIKNKAVISYINFKLRHFKLELEKINLVLLYDKIEHNADKFSVKIVSTLDSKEVKKKADEILNYFDQVKLLIVHFDKLSRVKEIEEDILSMNLSDLDFKYREDKKKFFINSKDQNALNLVKLIIESKR